MVLALGFGAAQAFAAPGVAPKHGAARRSCDQAFCDNTCRSHGYSVGLCETDYGTSYCTCY
jgi:hypothetical protein